MARIYVVERNASQHAVLRPLPSPHRLLDQVVGVVPCLGQELGVVAEENLDALPGRPRTLRGVDTRTRLPGAPPDRPVRVGSLVDSGLGPIDAKVAATVQVTAEALQGALGFRSRL